VHRNNIRVENQVVVGDRPCRLANIAEVSERQASTFVVLALLDHEDESSMILLTLVAMSH